MGELCIHHSLLEEVSEHQWIRLSIRIQKDSRSCLETFMPKGLVLLQMKKRIQKKTSERDSYHF